MKPNLHPAYGPVVFRDKAAGVEFLSNSTLAGRRDLPTLEWADGGAYPVFDVDVSAASHPFWTGNARVLDTEGRVEKFRRRYGRG
ncbi:type B 50S ribosomal protein L31 [Kineococcus rhizosphaerae]|uniref:Large ribosomal subunit protein bL31B n=1 Tax=Kineococcus rhizosphaerae TaxID=559628 RepID=A0A2T0QZR6_9ACTN|nr:type B 50S ribosomal protein L31 [Kineococcus rhizosphaerae]PRY12172.1 large subunit ribosomal protein L31 [Kineococcus rhizosphaerae]